MAIPRVFIIWDSKVGADPGAKAVGPAPNHLDNLRLAFEGRADVVVLGLPRDSAQGYVFDAIHDGLKGAAGAIALLDLPNANVGYEIGLALGLGVPVALVAMQEPAKGWLDHAPTASHLVQHRGFEPAGLKALIKDAIEGRTERWNRCTVAPSRETPSGLRWLWPNDATGESYRDVLPDVDLPRPPEDRLATLHEAFTDVERLVWVVTNPINEPRDGVENARLAIWAGFGRAHGVPTTILREEPVGVETRRLIDVHDTRTPFKDGLDLQAKVQALLGGPKPTAPDTLTAWRAWLRHRHGRLVPFADHHPKAELDLVHVPLEVCERGDGRGERARGGTLEPLMRGWAGSSTRSGSLEQVIRGWPTPIRLVVQADPGGGKTTTARHLAWTLAAPGSDNLGVVVALAAWKEGNDPLDQAERADETPGLAALLRQEAAKPGRVWLLLDGLDEVGGRREAVLAAISRFAEANPNIAIVVLSRTDALRGCFAEVREGAPVWQRAEIRGLSPALRDDLLRGLVPDDTHRAAILQQINALPRLTEIASNPLMLTLIGVVGAHELANGRRVPTSRPTLYSQAVRVLLEGRHRLPARPVRQPDVALQALGVIALELHARGGESWDDDTAGEAMLAAWRRDPEVFAQVEKFWGVDGRPGGPRELAEDLSESAGLFGKLDEDGRWRFRHRTLKEYLIARALLRLGEGEQETFFAAWEAEEPGDGGTARSEEIVALLTAMQPGSTARLAGLAQRAPFALVRLLMTTEGLAPDLVLSLLFSIGDEDEWDEEHLVTALMSAAGGVAELEAALWARVVPGASRREMVLLYHALARVAVGGDRRATLAVPEWREAFFARAGIPLPDLAKLHIERVPLGSPYVGPKRGRAVVRLIEVPGGTFQMGSPEGVGQEDEHPAHRVTVAAFAMGQTTITRAVWKQFDASPGTAQHPATRVTWHDAALFAAWLGGRLPTEAEWEYACRAGTDTRWSFGDKVEALAKCAWTLETAPDGVHPVAARAPNSWGFHDLHGNVWEWCADHLLPYDETAQDNPVGPRDGHRVIRGGSNLVPADWCRSAFRVWFRPRMTSVYHGLRVLFPAPAR